MVVYGISSHLAGFGSLKNKTNIAIVYKWTMKLSHTHTHTYPSHFAEVVLVASQICARVGGRASCYPTSLVLVLCPRAIACLEVLSLNKRKLTRLIIMCLYRIQPKIYVLYTKSNELLSLFSQQAHDQTIYDEQCVISSTQTWDKLS